MNNNFICELIFYYHVTYTHDPRYKIIFFSFFLTLMLVDGVGKYDETVNKKSTTTTNYIPPDLYLFMLSCIFLSITLLMLISTTNAFLTRRTLRSLNVFRSFSCTDPTSPGCCQAERFNKKVELESPKVVTSVSLNPGEKIWLCRCWKSEKFPYCDGAHAAHNKETGDNLGPALVSVPKAQ